jgi:hypothetical protein
VVAQPLPEGFPLLRACAEGGEQEHTNPGKSRRLLRLGGERDGEARLGGCEESGESTRGNESEQHERNHTGLHGAPPRQGDVR